MTSKRPRDVNQLAKLIVDISAGESEDAVSKDKLDTSLQGRAGGLKGGKARASSLTPEQRSEIARVAASAYEQLFQ